MLEWVAIGAGVILMNDPKKTKPSGGEGPRPFYLSDLPDVLPQNQGGNYKRDYDQYFYEYSEMKGVPFALMKAHAIQESSINHRAFRQEPNGKASYGLMQVLWWKNSNRFKQWGYSDDMIGDGSLLYDPEVNIDIASEIILDNFRVHKNLRDAVNSYNTGRNEATRPAPHDYVNKVLKYYSNIVGRQIT